MKASSFVTFPAKLSPVTRHRLSPLLPIPRVRGTLYTLMVELGTVSGLALYQAAEPSAPQGRNAAIFTLGAQYPIGAVCLGGAQFSRKQGTKTDTSQSGNTEVLKCDPCWIFTWKDLLQRTEFRQKMPQATGPDHFPMPSRRVQGPGTAGDPPYEFTQWLVLPPDFAGWLAGILNTLGHELS